MMACTWPASTVRLIPCKISRPLTRARKSLISSKAILVLTDASFQTDSEQLLRLHGEFHGQFAEYFLAEAVHDHRNGIFRGDAALPAVGGLVFAGFRCGGLVVRLRGCVL